MAQTENKSNILQILGQTSDSKFSSNKQSTISVNDTDGQTLDLAHLYSFYTIWAYIWTSYNDVYNSKCAAQRHKADFKIESFFFFAHCTEI